MSYVTIKGKRYLKKRTAKVLNECDYECCSLKDLSDKVQNLRQKYGDEACFSIDTDIDYEPYSDYGHVDLTIKVIYEEVESDDERRKRLDLNKKRREERKERERKRKEQQEERELNMLKNLAKKHGKQIV